MNPTGWSKDVFGEGFGLPPNEDDYSTTPSVLQF